LWGEDGDAPVREKREVSMTRRMRTALLLGVMLGLAAHPAAADEKLEGYAEWVLEGCLVVDGQKVCPAPGLKFEGDGAAWSFATIPLGYEVKVKKGTRLPDGTLLAREVEARPNGEAMFEAQVRAATDQMEARIRRAGRFSEGEGRRARSVGRLLEEGPRVDRVRRIVDHLLPPYLEPHDVRVYVIENEEWNAFAMGNYSIYVFSGLLDSLSDDEVAIVLGHELVHATHEHSRRQAKKGMWIQLAAIGALGATSTIDSGTSRALAETAAGLAASAWSNGYGRDMEDQADRVGLRYAYEAGYDITKGPALWKRFAEKYGEGSAAVNFFFGNHSLARERATHLEQEIALNYPDGAKPGGPPRHEETPAAPPGFRPAQTAAVDAAADASSAPAEVRPGMSPDEVRRILGEPESALVFGERLRWAYPDRTVVFEEGRVTEVRE
jgi:Zn-dependent protease with chaperone function